MTKITLTPSDSIQNAIDTFGGPGAEFVLTSGDYRQPLKLRGSRSSNNGAHNNPLRIILEEGARLLPHSKDNDTLVFQAPRYVSLEGAGPERSAIVGPDDDTDRKQAIHIHSSPKSGRYPTGLTVKGLKVEKRGGDAIKHSEGIGCVFEDLVIDGASGSDEESLFDANKFLLLTIQNVEFRNITGSTALVTKGGGIGGEIRNIKMRNVQKGVEVGGYEGSGYWPFLTDQLANGGADLVGDPLWEEAQALVRRAGRVLQWGARWVTLNDMDVDAQRYAFRTIDAWDVEANGALRGDENHIYTSSVDVGRGSYFTSNVRINGDQVVPVRGTSTPWTEPTQEPEPVVEPTPETAPEAENDPHTYVKGERGKETLSVGKNVLPTLIFKGFGLSMTQFLEHVTEKSDGLVIIDLLKHDGVRLVLKGRDIRDRWQASVVLEA